MMERKKNPPFSILQIFSKRPQNAKSNCLKEKGKKKKISAAFFDKF